MELQGFCNRPNLVAHSGYLRIDGDIEYLVTDLGRRPIRRSDSVIDELTSITEIFFSRYNPLLCDLEWMPRLVVRGVARAHPRWRSTRQLPTISLKNLGLKFCWNK